MRKGLAYFFISSGLMPLFVSVFFVDAHAQIHRPKIDHENKPVKVMGTIKQPSEDPATEATSSHDYQLFKLVASKVLPIGSGEKTEQGVLIDGAIVQSFPNKVGSGLMCHPVFVSKKEKPCSDDELLISFVKHTQNNKNEIPKRGTCFCVSKKAINETPENNKTLGAYLTAFASQNPDDHNAFSKKSETLVEFYDKKNQTPSWHETTVFSRSPQEPNIVQSWIETPHTFLNHITHEPNFEIDTGAKIRKLVEKTHTASLESPEWKTKDGKFKDPFAVGVESEEYKKEEVLKEYAYRSVRSLGNDYSPFALFHNAWKLSRLTRSNNSINLKMIDESVKKQLDDHFKDPKITAKLMPKYAAFNKYIWETMHTTAQVHHPQSPDSESVDGEFQEALNNGAHKEMWTQIHDIEETAKEALSSIEDSKFPATLTLADVRKINEYHAKAGAVPPLANMCKREFTSYNSRGCPCVPKAAYVPCNLNLPSLKKDFVAKKIDFGKGKTYELVDEKTLPSGLRSSTFTARRTGYSPPNNSPAGTEKAGFAAIRRLRGGKDGRATLGKGTLESPITAAVSPATARNYGVCQGDIIHDPDYGWLRIEGGCTSGGLGNRVDVWRGNVSTRSLHADSLLNSNRTFRHFPAGLVDIDYARKNPK